MSKTLVVDDLERDVRDHLLREGVKPPLADDLVAIMLKHAPEIAAAERERIGQLAAEKMIGFQDASGHACPDHGAHLGDWRPFSELLRG